MTAPKLSSWINVPSGSDFPLQNLPFGIGQTSEIPPFVCTRIGNSVIDLHALCELGFLDGLGIDASVFAQSTLNALMACGKAAHQNLRKRLLELFAADSALAEQESSVILPLTEVKMLMPIQIGNYTDFYSSLEHAMNVGKMLRPDNPLMPNWKHLPVGYHGRASSIGVSGTNFHRPKGQFKPDDAPMPLFGLSKQMDFELEMGFVIGKESALGQCISVEEAESYIFGFLIFNDWSARDIQRWEYVPLGPFLGKNFASTVSPWIVTLEALEAFRTEPPAQDVSVLPYLERKGKQTFDIQLEVFIKPKGGQETKVCTSNYKHLYWTFQQQLAHHTINGCNVSVGDLYASGTISGSTPDSFGSMLELAWRGTKPLILSDGTQRSFLQDYDTVIMRAFAEKNNLRIGFGEVEAQILPALP